MLIPWFWWNNSFDWLLPSKLSKYHRSILMIECIVAICLSVVRTYRTILMPIKKVICFNCTPYLMNVYVSSLSFVICMCVECVMNDFPSMTLKETSTAAMAPHLLVSLYTVCSAFVRESNDNNVRLKSLIPFLLHAHNRHQSISIHCSLSVLPNISLLGWYAFSSFRFVLNLLLLFALLHLSGIFFFKGISTWYCYCYLISHSKSSTWNEMPWRAIAFARYSYGKIGSYIKQKTSISKHETQNYEFLSFEYRHRHFELNFEFIFEKTRWHIGQHLYVFLLLHSFKSACAKNVRFSITQLLSIADFYLSCIGRIEQRTE